MGFDGPTGSRNSVMRPISLPLLSAGITQWAGENAPDDRRAGFPDEIIPAAPNRGTRTRRRIIPGVAAAAGRGGGRGGARGEARAHDK